MNCVLLFLVLNQESPLVCVNILYNAASYINEKQISKCGATIFSSPLRSKLQMRLDV